MDELILIEELDAMLTKRSPERALNLIVLPHIAQNISKFLRDHRLTVKPSSSKWTQILDTIVNSWPIYSSLPSSTDEHEWESWNEFAYNVAITLEDVLHLSKLQLSIEYIKVNIEFDRLQMQQISSPTRTMDAMHVLQSVFGENVLDLIEEYLERSKTNSRQSKKAIHYKRGLKESTELIGDRRSRNLRLYIDTSEISKKDLSELLVLLSDLYESIGGDRLIVDSVEVYRPSQVLAEV